MNLGLAAAGSGSMTVSRQEAMTYHAMFLEAAAGVAVLYGDDATGNACSDLAKRLRAGEVTSRLLDTTSKSVKGHVGVVMELDEAQDFPATEAKQG